MRKLHLLILLATVQIAAFAQTDKAQLAQQIIEEMEVVDASLPQINLLRKQGEKNQARALAENMLKQVEKIEADRKRLSQMGELSNEEVPSLAEIQETKQYLSNRINLLRYTCLYIRCEADLFNEEYETFCADVRTKMSDTDVSFVENAEEADWTIMITAKAREYTKQTFGEMTTYFAYADAEVIVEKTASGKRICQKRISEKGGDMSDYKYAAIEAYKYLVPKVSTIIKEQMQQ